MANELETAARGMRAEEQWLRYDTVCIGPGAKDIDAGWFNTWEEFAKASKIVWGNERQDAGDSFSNLSGPQEDFAQVIYQSGVDFIPPLGMLGFESQLLDSLLPAIFVRDLPKAMAFHVIQANTDDIAVVPGGHMPGVSGVTGAQFDGAGSLVLDGGQRGTADTRNSWQWPTPLKVPAKSKLQVVSRVDGELRDFFLSLPITPGTKTIPFTDSQGELQTTTYQNFYRIRVWHRGPRFVQLRGARSA
jgi:hypothetical protein